MLSAQLLQNWVSFICWERKVWNESKISHLAVCDDFFRSGPIEECWSAVVNCPFDVDCQLCIWQPLRKLVQEPRETRHKSPPPVLLLSSRTLWLLYIRSQNIVFFFLVNRSMTPWQVQTAQWILILRPRSWCRRIWSWRKKVQKKQTHHY